MAKVRLEIRANSHDVRRIESYGGVDIAVYHIKDPITFLQHQKNLHRIETNYNYKPKGMISSALSYVWDSFYKKSRLAWQRILSFNARKSVTETTHKFRQKPPYTYKTNFKHYKQFRKMRGFDLLDEFRYPITDAKPIEPIDIKLSGSSHNFREVNPGNIYVPLGKLASGLYLVEAVIGDHRANTLVFVSDSVLITKTSSMESFMWAVSKSSGTPAPNTKVLITDGLGYLKKGVTDKDGVLRVNLKTPELTYVIGQDSQGGVFISENYYYDSEIYSEKIYAFTDRPLYRPGSKVSVKVIGRKFTNSSKSEWLKNKVFKAMIIDSAGTILFTTNFKLSQENAGGEFSFRLPKYALSGGYTILLKDKLKSYSSEFRVSKYTKPHYNIDILFSKDMFKIGEEITGSLKLTYSNGSPVQFADIDLFVRRQKLNIIEGERDAESLFPVKVDDLKLISNDKGEVEFKLPKVNVPSRYILSVKAKDEASFSVRASRELLIELNTPTYRIVSDELFSDIGSPVEFTLEENISLADLEEEGQLKWKFLRLEDQSERTGDINGQNFEINFKIAGTYKLLVLNQNGDVVGGKTHIVRGEKLEALPGTVQIILDKEDYDLNDKVRALINFSEDVENALLTIERNKVEDYSISGEGSNWITVDKKSKRQWVAEIPMQQLFAPNITFSVLFVKNGKFVFSNKGIRVKMPKINISYSLDKLEYGAGENVNVKIKTTYLNKPISSNITFSVVDEMMYVLQPELTPDITDFFYHIRRNQVKTTSSLDFHTYDASISATGRSSYSDHYSDRPLKMRERTRRENVDTAFWKTNIKTDSLGEAEVTFKLPDSLTRWRLTSRAISNDGAVGQSIAHIKSFQNAYIKWGGLSDFRKGDESSVNIIAFNMESSEFDGNISLQGGGANFKRNITLKPGINFTAVNLKADKTQDISIKLTGESLQDALVKRIEVQPVNWVSSRSVDLKVKKGKNTIELPKGGFNFRLMAFSNLYSRFINAARDLINYPHGCVEQTASKLIPLSIAYGILKKSDKKANLEKIKENIINARERLVAMANRSGLFGWYNDMPNNSYMTAYAYLADFYAGKVLGVSFSHDHWRKILEAYRKYSSDNVLRNSIVLWISSFVGEPVQSMIELQVNTIEKELASGELFSFKGGRNYIMGKSGSVEHYRLASVMLKLTTQNLLKEGYKLAKPIQDKVDRLSREAIKVLDESEYPLLMAAALSMRAPQLKGSDIVMKAENILKKINQSYSTADRSMALILMHESLGAIDYFDSGILIDGPVQKIKSIYGLDSWQLRGESKPIIDIKSVGDENIDLRLYYDTYKKDEHRLDVKVSRRFYSLEKKENKYIASLVDLNTSVNTNRKYIDEIVIEPNPNEDESIFSHGMIEVPIPPGASIQTELGQIEVVKINESGSDETIHMDSLSRLGNLTYTIPVKELAAKKVFRHVIQFSAKGKYKLPMTRFFEMYEPRKKAYRGMNEVSVWELKVD